MLDALPLPRIQLARNRARPFWAGHAMVRPGSLEPGTVLPAPGRLVLLADDRGTLVGPAWTEGGEVAAWLLSPSSHALVAACMRTDGTADLEALVGGLLDRARERRAHVFQPRLLVAEDCDDLPGLRVRRFDEAVLAHVGSRALGDHREWLAPLLRARLGVRDLLAAGPAGSSAHPTDESATMLAVREEGVAVDPHRWAANPTAWDRTQPLRRWAALAAPGRRCVDLTGTLGVAAQAASVGAQRSVGAREAPGALAVADEALLGVEVIERAADAAAQQLADRGQAFDVVAGRVEPAGDAARDARKRLDQRVWGLLRLVAPEGGMLLVWSPDEGEGDAPLLASAASAAGRLRRSVRVLSIVRSLEDEPTRVAMRESRVWTLLVLAVEADVARG